MINAIIEAISVSLNEEFGENYKTHMEEIRQGLEEPCFFIACLNPASERFPGNRYFRTNQFCIQYFPESDEKQRECNEAADRMWQCLEYITAPSGDRPIRGTKMRYEVVDGVLNFFVNYDCFVYQAKQDALMGSLKTNSSVKKRGR